MRRNTFLIMKQKLQLLPHFLRDDRLFMLLQYFVSLSYVVLEFLFFFKVIGRVKNGNFEIKI